MTSLNDTSRAVAMTSVGDVVTFEELYAQQYRPMVRLAHTLVDTQQRAEDAVQDAFAAIYERYDRLEWPEAYLRVTVRNGCRRVLAGGCCAAPNRSRPVTTVSPHDSTTLSVVARGRSVAGGHVASG
jgi:hypothetical protein